MATLLKKIQRHLFARSQVTEFLKLPAKRRKIVFYSEDDFSYIHFEKLIENLIRKYGHEITYLTSQFDDPLFQKKVDGLTVFYVGNGIARTSLFINLKASIFVMTMPDLETYHIKRSKISEVHYVYLFHAMVSTHSNYRKAAFDHFDTIFLTGGYQGREIRATEKAYNLKEKSLVEFGYPRLESLLADVDQWRHKHALSQNANQTPKVIVAPSWGDDAILESIGHKLIQLLLEKEFDVTVRPHPQTTRLRPDVIEQLLVQFSESKNFRLEVDIRDKSSLYNADVMISDWSGVAIEYAFSCERPVIFIDVPKKRNNPDADKIDMIPVEVSIRNDIGVVVSPDDLESLPMVILDCIANREMYVSEIEKIRNAYVFNLNASVEVGSAHIHKLASE